MSDVFAYAPIDASQSFSDAIKNIALIPFQFNVYTVPMWYLYMLIGLYLYMPFFSFWVEQATVRQKKIFLMFWSFSLFLPYAYSFFSPNLLGVSAWNTFGTLYYFAGFNGYLLLGNYLFNDVKEWKWCKTIILSLPVFAIGYIATYIGFKTMTANPECSEQEMELFFLYCSPNVALMTLAFFLVIRKVRVKSKRMILMLENITKCGLGIYMIHYFIVGLGYAIADTLAIPVFLRIPVTAVIVFVICWVFVSACYKFAPKYSKWIFG